MVKINDVLQRINPIDGKVDLFRVLWIVKSRDLLVLIPVPSDYKNAKYFKGKKNYSLEKVLSAIEIGSIQLSNVEIRPLLLLSDEEIRKRYPPNNTLSDSYPLMVRDKQWAYIESIVAHHNGKELFETYELGKYVREVVMNQGVSKDRVYNSLNRYWSSGSDINSLLPLIEFNGGPGKERKQTVKIGTKKRLVAKGLSENNGIVLSNTDKDNLGFGWNYFLKPWVTVEDAWIETLGVFWSSGTIVVDGLLIPKLLPVNECPSKRQFLYWGEKRSEAAKKKQMPDLEWEKNYRGLTGSVKDGVYAIGQVAFCDASPTDVHLVSKISRLRPIGTCHRILIRDVKSELISGVYCGLDAPSGQTALLAIENASSDKVAYCKRFGIEIESDEWPAMSHTTYHVDNGEFRNKKTMTALNHFNAEMELIRSRRPDLNSMAESAHHILHARVDHKLDGSTYGKPSPRGKDVAAFYSCHEYYEYMPLLIKAILYYNNEADASHLLTLEMRKDGVAPTRLSIYRWMCNQGYIVSHNRNRNIIRAHLLPKIKAVVHYNGIFLLRPDVGRRKIIIREARFINMDLAKIGWFERARNSGVFYIDVNYNPDNLTVAWYIDSTGMYELENVCEDSILVREGCLADYLDIQDFDRDRIELNEDQFLQSLAELNFHRNIANDEARDKKQQEKDNAGRKITKKELTSNIGINRKSEIDLIKKAWEAVLPETKTSVASSKTTVKRSLVIEEPERDNKIRAALKNYFRDDEDETFH